MSNAPEEPSGYKKYVPGGDKPMAPDARRRLLMIGCIAFVFAIFVIPPLFGHKVVKSISYSKLLRDASHQQVDTAVINSTSSSASRVVPKRSQQRLKSCVANSRSSICAMTKV